MKVMLLGKATKASESGEMPSEKAIVAMHEFNEEMEKAGILRELGGLTPSRMGARIQYKGGEAIVIDGPFAEAKELVAGYAIIEVKDLAEAIAWAKRAPFGVDGYAECELRPLWDASMFEPPAG